MTDPPVPLWMDVEPRLDEYDMISEYTETLVGYVTATTEKKWDTHGGKYDQSQLKRAAVFTGTALSEYDCTTEQYVHISKVQSVFAQTDTVLPDEFRTNIDNLDTKPPNTIESGPHRLSADDVAHTIYWHIVPDEESNTKQTRIELTTDMEILAEFIPALILLGNCTSPWPIDKVGETIVDADGSTWEVIDMNNTMVHIKAITGPSEGSHQKIPHQHLGKIENTAFTRDL